MAAKRFLYFVYGSNLLRERLVLANPSAVFKAVGKLEGYQLVFRGHSGRWQGGVASIEEREDSDVWGVVWQLDLKDRDSLDRQEALYTPMEVEVQDTSGERFRCRTYQLGLGWQSGPPSPHYKDVILRGATQNLLPANYLHFLQRIHDNGFQGDVAVYNEVMKLLSK